MLKFEISGQKLTRVDTFAPATDSKLYLKAAFTFSSDWASAAKTAIFRDEVTGESYEAPLNSSGVCTVPAEVLTRSTAVHYQTQGNHFHVSLRGDIGSTLITTNEVKVELARSGYTEGQTPATPSPDAYSQFVANVKEDADRAVASAEAAAASEHNVANLYANALKKTATGEIIRVDDVSPVAHELGLLVHGKNLAKFSNAANFNRDQFTYTAESAEGVSCTRSANEGGAFYARFEAYLKAGVMYTISAKSSLAQPPVFVYTDELWGNAVWSANIPQGGLPFFVNQSGVHVIGFYISGATTSAVTLSEVQIEAGTAATAYEAYKDPAVATLTRAGKNLLPYPFREKTKTQNGITFTDNGDGTIIADGTATAAADFAFFADTLRVKGTYTLSGMSGGAGDTYFIQPYIDGESQGGLIEGSRVYEWDGELTRLVLHVAAGATLPYVRIKLQLEKGGTATNFEPYKGATYNPAADGTVSGVGSVGPCMTLLTDTPGMTVEATYHRDLVKAIEALEAALLN